MIVSVASSSAGVATGISAALDPLARKGASSASAPPRLPRSGVEDQRLAARSSRADLASAAAGPARAVRAPPGRRARRSRAPSARPARPALVRHPDHAASTPSSSTIDDASTSRVVRATGSARRCARSRAARAAASTSPARTRALRSSSSLSVVTRSCSRAFLDGDRQRGQRGEQGATRSRSGPARARVDGEDADRLVADDEAERERRPDPGLRRGARTCSSRSSAVVVELDDQAGAATAAARSAWAIDSCDPRRRGCPRRRARPCRSGDGDPVDVEQVRDALDRRLERVRARAARSPRRRRRAARGCARARARRRAQLGRADGMCGADGEARSCSSAWHRAPGRPRNGPGARRAPAGRAAASQPVQVRPRDGEHARRFRIAAAARRSGSSASIAP